jgi:hypothetical protein
VIREDEMGRAYRTYGEKKECLHHFGGKSGKRSLGRHTRRWEDNIKMDLRETGWGDMGWIDLAQDRDRWRVPVNTVLKLRLP